jgi:hypothetical protein
MSIGYLLQRQVCNCRRMTRQISRRAAKQAHRGEIAVIIFLAHQGIVWVPTGLVWGWR